MLSDQQGELIPQAGLTVVWTFWRVVWLSLAPVAGARVSKVQMTNPVPLRSTIRFRMRLLRRARLTGPRFGYAHLRTADERRYI